MHYPINKDLAALHILSPCPHHNIPLISMLSKLNQHLINEYLILDKEENFKCYSHLDFQPMAMYTSNSELFPWLRDNNKQYQYIVIHGFFNQVLWQLLEENEAIRKKCIWVVYGGDLCDHKTMSADPSKQVEINRIKSIIPDLKKILTFTKGEDDILNSLYGKKCNIGKYMYYQSYEGKPIEQRHTKITHFFESELETAVIGNSGTESNRHIFVIKKLAEQNFQGQLLLPLSYCLEHAYHDEIISACEKYFPKRYFLLTELLTNENYFSVLKKCDYFFMAHLRQQAGQHWMFAFFHNKPIYGDSNSPFINTLSGKNMFWGDIDNISLSDDYLQLFSSNKSMYEKHYGLAAVQRLWLEAFDIES